MVVERLEEAHGEDARPKGIAQIQTVLEEWGGRLICHCYLIFKDGRKFEGISEVPLDSTSPAEKDAPFEVAETSAWGRALASAGYYGSNKGIAGLEELSLAATRALNRDNNPPRASGQSQGSAPSSGGLSDAQKNYIRSLARNHKIEVNVNEMTVAEGRAFIENHKPKES